MRSSASTRGTSLARVPTLVERGDDEVGRLVVVVRIELVQEEAVLAGKILMRIATTKTLTNIIPVIMLRW